MITYQNIWGNHAWKGMVWPCLYPKYFGTLPRIYQLNIVWLHLWRFRVCNSWGELRSHYPVCPGIWLPFPPKILGSSIIFEILFYVAATTKNIFCVNNAVKFAHLSVAPKFYNSLIPLNKFWLCLSSKYFGKLLHIKYTL